MTTERQRMFEVAHALGHDNPEVWQDSRGRFFAACSCGWESTYRRTFVDALGAGIRHALGEARPIYARIKRSGRPAGAILAEAARSGFTNKRLTPSEPRERFKRAA